MNATFLHHNSRVLLDYKVKYSKSKFKDKNHFFLALALIISFNSVITLVQLW